MLFRRVNLPAIEELQEATFTTEIAPATPLLQNLFKVLSHFFSMKNS
jgi:hypothetical protein